ncbi:MopE-related protein [uncultured Kordia sp.]|uniref:MopE-related protein n=1 Tax=uncultured Kordia sp. TaxID=507699 RepID=UPI002632B0E1|nr:MopE-related protein [uncultured Kordia sp.]
MKISFFKSIFPILLLVVAVFIIGSSCSDPSQAYYNWYPDVDQDGFGSSANSISATLDEAPIGYVRDTSDCDDTDATINPDATEIPNNAIDEDCNNLFAYTFYKDGDDDGFGDPNVEDIIEIENIGETPNGFSRNDGDCDDANPTINPLADEIVGNDIDDNCNGETDIDDVRYIDADGDGYGSQNQAAADGVFNNLDCDDTDGEVHPYADEIPNNSIDDDCDGMVDEN